jgi:hypothetical protein
MTEVDAKQAVIINRKIACAAQKLMLPVEWPSVL